MVGGGGGGGGARGAEASLARPPDVSPNYEKSRAYPAVAR